MSLTGIPELRDAYRAAGPLRFALWMGGVLLWIGIFAWLSMTATWPEGCDHSGRKLVGLIREMRCSPGLLAGGVREYALFAFLWTLPAVVIGALIYAAVKRRRRDPLSNKILSE
jgi:hypothetical protein